MIPGIMAGQMRAAAVGGALWTPLNMATVPQIYLHAEDSVVTDVSGACSAISNLGAMGAAGDFSQATAANRPAILAAELNGKRVLRFDGVNDHLLGASAAQKGIFQNVPVAWVFVVLKKIAADTADVTRVIVSSSVGASSASRVLAACGYGAVGNKNKPTILLQRPDGAATAALVSPVQAGSYYMGMFEAAPAIARGRIYTNGTLAAEDIQYSSVGNTSDTPSLQPLALGCFPNVSAGFADMDVAAVVMGNSFVTSDDIDKLFGWSADEFGLTANLPIGHPYKTVAPTV